MSFHMDGPTFSARVMVFSTVSMASMALWYRMSYRVSASTDDRLITASTWASTTLASIFSDINIWDSHKMNRAFYCRLHHNSNIGKIKKFFEGSETLYVLAGNAGIAFEALTPDNTCMYLIHISSCDIYQLYVRPPDPDREDDPWKSGGIYRSIPAPPLLSFIESRDMGHDLLIEIDDDATKLMLSIVNGVNVVRSTSIPLVIPDVAYEVPRMTNANVVMKINELKSLCSNITRGGQEVKVEYQDEAIRLVVDGNTVTHGNWIDDGPTKECVVDKTPFSRVTKINIGNAKNWMSGIYIQDGYPMMLRIKFGIIDFMVCAKVKEPL